ncbi:MAG: shikimate dehydrogenase [Armatimonadota bacterium]
MSAHRGFTQIGGTTKVLCVIGHPVAHSFSPRMHNAAIAELGLDLCYVAFDVSPEDVELAVRGMRALGILGMNVTVPHKQAVIPFLDELSEEAKLVGAVNTIRNDGGRLRGFNTDVYGILTALRETAGLDPLPARIAVLGASGAARAVAYALATAREVRSVTIFNRTGQKAVLLAEEMSAVTGKNVTGRPLTVTALSDELPKCGLLVNATSVGMHPNVHASPLPDSSLLHPSLVVYDAVFNPRETMLMRQALSAGCRAYNGLDMLLYQGALSFEIWTGVRPPIDVMRKALYEASESR